MKRLALAASILAASATPAFAGNFGGGSDATAVGVGIAASKANSTSKATAIGGGNAQATGGKATAIGGGNSGGNVSINSSVPANTTQTITTQGTTTVRSAPSVVAPGLAAAGIESCLGSVSGGASFIGTGFSFGGSTPDNGCNARLNARTLWAFGLKKAAVALLCQQADIYNSMPDVCLTYSPHPVVAPVVAPVAYGEAPSADYYYSDLSTYRGGPIWLLDGSSGKERICTNYDVSRKHCRTWEGAVSPAPKQVSRPVRGYEHRSAVSPSVEVAKKEDRYPVYVPPTQVAKAETPLWLKLIHPEQPAATVAPQQKEGNTDDDEGLRKCLGFCAAPGGVKR